MHASPAVAFVVPQPIHFFGIQRRQSAGDPLSPQIIFVGMLAHVGDDGVVAPLDAEFFAAGFLNQLAGVPEADGEKFHETDRVGLLPGIVPFFRAPLDEAGPAGQRGQLQRQVILAEIRGNAERVQTLKQRIFGIVGQLREIFLRLSAMPQGDHS